jgi:hypothetical protein
MMMYFSKTSAFGVTVEDIASVGALFLDQVGQVLFCGFEGIHNLTISNCFYKPKFND